MSMTTTMRALLLDRPGAPGTLRVGEIEKPEPGPGDVRVRIYAASLNPADYKIMNGGLPTWEYPHIPGLDGAGVVDAVGAGVDESRIGERVYFHADMTKRGALAEFAIAKAHVVAPIPEGVSFEEAASIPTAGLTAYLALQRKMRLREGQTLLVHAGAGGVGSFAIQYARSVGARVIATASPANADYVRALGAEEVVDYASESVHDRVMAWTNGRGVDAALNSVNRATAQVDLELLAFDGQLACIAGAPENVADFKPSTKTFSVHKLMLGGAYGDRIAEEALGAMAREFIELYAAEGLRSVVSETIELEQAPGALARLAERHVRGKIVVRLA
ncbi:zinc-binding dehydrogenase [Paenibacillus sp. TRM 82003]|nr:zinc-binding dehydrogenase [Paenibacillus sp. TRM 82003]